MRLPGPGRQKLNKIGRFVSFRLQAFAGAIQNNLFCIIFDGEIKPGPDGKRATRPCLLSHQPAAREPQAQRRAPTPPPKAGGKSTPPAPVHGGARKGKKGLTSSPPRGNIKERKGRCPGSRTTPVFLFPGAAGFFFSRFYHGCAAVSIRRPWNKAALQLRPRDSRAAARLCRPFRPPQPRFS